jgi:hypothetical protein
VVNTRRSTPRHIERKVAGVDSRSTQAIIHVRLHHGVTVDIEASLILLRRGRALLELWMVEPWNNVTRRSQRVAVSATIGRLRHSRF